MVVYRMIGCEEDDNGKDGDPEVGVEEHRRGFWLKTDQEVLPHYWTVVFKMGQKTGGKGLDVWYEIRRADKETWCWNEEVQDC